VGSEQMGKAGLLGGGGGGGRGIPREGLLGSGLMPAVFGEAGMEHAKKYGTSFEQFASVAVKNHHHSVRNPKSMYQIETPLEQVMNAEMICYPNTKLMCSVNVDGSAAAVLVSERKARQLGMQRAVKVAGSALTSDPWTERDLVMPDVNTCTRAAAKIAYEMAGVKPSDIKIVELHDAFVAQLMVTMGEMGFVKIGKTRALIDEGIMADIDELGDDKAPKGKQVLVNPSGGLIFGGHFVGGSNMFSMWSARREMINRQVPLALVHGTGAMNACFGGAIVLELDERGA